MNGREQFRARVEEAVGVNAEGDEARECLERIRDDERSYWCAMARLPDVHEFTVEELRKKTGKAAELLDLAAELARLQAVVERRLEQLHFLSKYPSQ
jgi:hypothetical protein